MAVSHIMKSANKSTKQIPNGTELYSKIVICDFFCFMIIER